MVAKGRGRATRLLWAALQFPLLVFPALVFPALDSWGQQYSRHEAALGFESQTASLYLDLAPSSYADYIGARHIFPGPFGRYTVNLSPSLALEGSVGYLPGYQTSFGVDNGHELLALGGIKAGWRGRAFGLYGKLEPGIASFSPGLNVNLSLGQPADFQRRTNFALDYGGALEFYPSPRTIIRADVSQTLVAGYDQVLERTANFTDLHEGHIGEHLGLALSVAHRFGALRDETERIPARQPFDFGLEYALQQRVHLSLAQLQPSSGAGAWLSWNFSRWVSLDGAAFYEPKRDGFIFPQDGGTTTDVLAGLKAGIRRDRLGYFLKVRPGVIQFSRTNDLDIPPRVYWEKTTDFAIDGGGVVEVYPSRHTLLRAEAGNTFIHYHAAEVTVEPGGVEHYSPARRSSILILFGGGIRF